MANEKTAKTSNKTGNDGQGRKVDETIMLMGEELDFDLNNLEEDDEKGAGKKGSDSLEDTLGREGEGDVTLTELGSSRLMVSFSLGKGIGFLKQSARTFQKEIQTARKGETLDEREGAPYVIPTPGTKESWMVFSGLLMLILMFLYYPFISRWYEHFEIFNALMFLIFGVIVLRSFVHILVTAPEARRLEKKPIPGQQSKLEGVFKLLTKVRFALLVLLIIVLGASTYLENMGLTFATSSIALFLLYYIFYTAKGVSHYEGLRLGLVILGFYLILIVPTHEALGLMSWKFKTLPMDPRNEVLLILGTSLLIAGIALLKERVGFFTIWLLGNLVMLLIPFHELLGFISQSKYEYFDRSLIMLGSILITTGYIIFAHRYLKYKELEDYIERGLAAYYGGKYKTAMKFFRKAFWVAENTGFLMDFDLLWGLMGNTYFKMGKYERALAYYAMALSINPRNSSVHNDLGNLYFKRNRFGPALQTYERALKLTPGNYVIHHNKGLILSSLGRFEESLESFDKALELNPDFEIGWKDKGVALANIERYSEAIPCFEKAIEINGESEAWFEMGRSYFNQQRYEDAYHTVEKASKYYPNNHSIFTGMARCLIELNRFQDAEEALKKAIKLDDSNPRAWNHLANVKYALGDADGATRSFKRAITLDPNYGLAKYNLARVLKNESQEPEALEAYDQAVRNASRVPFEQEKLREAEEFYEYMQKRFPAKYEVWMVIGNLFFKKGFVKRALEFYDKAITLNPYDAKLWNLKGIAHRKIRKNKAALNAFKKAVDMKKDYAEGYMNMANIHQVLGDYSAAISLYNKALELSNNNKSIIRNRRICINKMQRSVSNELISNTDVAAPSSKPKSLKMALKGRKAKRSLSRKASDSRQN